MYLQDQLECVDEHINETETTTIPLAPTEPKQSWKEYLESSKKQNANESSTTEIQNEKKRKSKWDEHNS